MQRFADHLTQMGQHFQSGPSWLVRGLLSHNDGLKSSRASSDEKKPAKYFDG